MYLFFDTETTGLPKNHNAPASDLANWPRLVQIAWMLADDMGNETKSAEYILEPEGFTIPAEAARIHGITNERAQREGLSSRRVLEEMAPDISEATLLVAHNVEFDAKVLGAEFLRLGRENPVDRKARKCTMKSSTNYCGIVGQYGNKWPTLQELHCKLFGQGFEDAHNALVDVRACSKCYFELWRLGVM